MRAYPPPPPLPTHNKRARRRLVVCTCDAQHTTTTGGETCRAGAGTAGTDVYYCRCCRCRRVRDCCDRRSDDDDNILREEVGYVCRNFSLYPTSVPSRTYLCIIRTYVHGTPVFPLLCHFPPPPTGVVLVANATTHPRPGGCLSCPRNGVAVLYYETVHDE